MKITLFRAFPDGYRQSMTHYADELIKNITPLLIEGTTLRGYLPQSIRLNPAPVRYLSQYLIYQLAASAAAGDINHIIDHSYAHLLHTLPADKTAVTFHDAIWLEESAGWGRGAIQRYNLSALQKAGAIICDSEASRRDLLSYLSYPQEKTSIIYPGLDPLFFQSFDQNPFEVLGLKKGLYLLHTGHTGHYKNIPALFHVLSGLRKQGLDVKLLKAGMPFSAQQTAVSEKLQITDSIVHLGLVKRELLPYVYRAAQCLLFPSFNEGFGFPILEAMASGTPVISSNRGSLPELSAHPERLCDPEDYEKMTALAAGIIQNTSVREHLIQKGKEKAHSFQWTSTARQILNVYKRLGESL